LRSFVGAAHNGGFAMAASQKILVVKHINVKCNDNVS
jgi:hypothetical protein